MKSGGKFVFPGGCAAIGGCKYRKEGACMRVGRTIAMSLWLSTAVAAFAATSSGQAPPERAPANQGNNVTAVHHYEDGVKAAKSAQWAKARESFLAAWKIKQHFQIAANLGRAELKLRKYRDAAEHLAFFLKEASGATPEELKAAQAMLDEARAKVGAVSVLVDRPGAQVLVDGVAVGKTPIEQEVFVEPGRRQIEAKLGGFADDRRSLDVVAGASQKVLLTLQPNPSAVADRGPADRGLSPNGMDLAAESDKERVKPKETAGTASTALLVTGIGATAVAAGVGVVSLLIAKGKGNDASDLYIQHTDNCDSAGSVCVPAGYNDLVEQEAMLKNLAFWSFIGAGAVGASTLIYALTRQSPKSEPSLTASALAGSTGGGLLVTGKW